MKKCFFFLIFICFLCFFAVKRTDNFQTNKLKQPSKILKKCQLLGKKEFDEKDFKKIEKILSQNFYYLDKGRQAYVFLSFDKKYVIKFINYKSIYYPKFLKNFEKFNFIKRILKRRDKKLKLTINGLFLASNILKEEAKTVFSNIDQNIFKKKIRIFNKYGQKFEVNLNDTLFVIQEKMDSFISSFEKCTNKKCFKNRLDQIIKTIEKRVKKGIADDDIDIFKNMGFLNGKFFILDTGRLYLNKNLKTDKASFEKEMVLSTKKLKKWLKDDVSMQNYLDEKILEIVNKNF